jgi:hypothetical protein
MIILPIEIINYILSFREKHPISHMIYYVVKDCYQEDYNPYTLRYVYDWYYHSVSFYEWYFTLIREKRRLNKPIYRLTPFIIKVGSNILYKLMDV